MQCHASCLYRGDYQNLYIMIFKRFLFWGGFASLSLFSSCGEDENTSEDIRPETYEISGKAEPFLAGSAVAVLPLKADMQGTGEVFTTTVKDVWGNFSLGPTQLTTPYAELFSTGYFFSLGYGDNMSESTLTLSGLADLSVTPVFNINVLTHLKVQRIRKLVADGKSFSEANTQAQNELLSAFGLQRYAGTDVSSFSMTAGTDEAGVLIAVSWLLSSEGYNENIFLNLPKVSKEFGENGIFSETTKAQMREVKKSPYSLSNLRDNIIWWYKKQGVEVKVKELTHFIDWDEDGTAGNETLGEGQEVTLETTELDVPNEGGDYTINFSSPIPLYLEPMEDGPSVIGPDTFWKDMYEGGETVDIVLDKKIEGQQLVLKIGKLKSRSAKVLTVNLYDCLNNVLGSVKITQQGDKNAALPRLGENSKYVVSAMALSLAEGFSRMNLIEQYYHYNKYASFVTQRVSPTNSEISDMWNSFYTVNNRNLMFKDTEADRLSIYQEYCSAFSALYYYYMVVVWGDVPYINDYDFYQGVNFNISRTSQNDIFDKLEKDLLASIDYFEEKRNRSLSGDVNDYFFLSKDVARILLADVYMYRGKYGQAEGLLARVVENGFYSLDASDYSKPETINRLLEEGDGPETVFAVYTDHGTRSDVTVSLPPVVPVMTYTDVVLSYAECLYKNGKTSEAQLQVNEVKSAKGIQMTGSNVLEEIRDIRMRMLLYGVSNFTFMKRNGFAESVYGVEKYRLLWPIPQRELDVNPSMTPNPGY